MSFFQTLTNAYVPYKENLIRNNFDASFINSAYNDCHTLIGKSVDKSTHFKRKCALEIMLFLIAIGLRQLASIKHTTNSELYAPILSISVALTSSLKDELYELIEAKGDVTNFLNDRIEEYVNMLDNPDMNTQHILMLLFLEKPLVKIEKEEEYDYETEEYKTYYILDTDNAILSKDLGTLIKIQPLIAEAVSGMRKSIKRMYGLE